MALPVSPQTSVKANLKDPATKTRKGFLWGLLSRSPQVCPKTVTRQPSAPEVRYHTTREPSRRLQSQVQPAPFISTQDPPQIPKASIPCCKDHLRELGLTTPVVLTQPRVAGSETVLPRVDKVLCPQDMDMLFSSMRSVSSKTSPTSSRSKPGLPRRNVRPKSDYVDDNEEPVWDITYDDILFAPLATSPSPADSFYPEASRMAVGEKFGEVPQSTVHNTVLTSVHDGEISFSNPPTVSLSTSIPSSSSTSHSRAPSSSHTKRLRKFPSVDSMRVPAASRNSQLHAPIEPISLFPVDEGLFGRPKPPPPLKIISKKTKQHQRKETAPTPLLLTSTSHERPLATRKSHSRSQTMHQTSVLRTLPSESAGYLHVSDGFISDGAALPKLPSGSMPDLPALVYAQARSEHSLSRTNTRVTVSSEQTQASPISELPHNAKWTWTPPTCWSGPPPVNYTEGGDSVPGAKKPAFSAMTQLRRSKSSSKLVTSAAKLFFSHPDPSPVHSVATKLGDNGPLPPAQDKGKSRCVVVRMQGFPGDDLKEAPLHDVIPRLRELKSSAL